MIFGSDFKTCKGNLYHEKKRYIENKVLIGLIIVILMGLMISVFSYYFKREDIKNSEMKNMVNISNNIDTVLDNFLGSMRTLYEIHYFDYTARDILLTDSKETDFKKRLEDSLYMDNSLKHIVGWNPGIEQATIISKYGNVYSNNPSVFAEYLEFIEAQKEANIPKEFKGTYYTQKYNKGSLFDNTTVITAIHPMYAYENSEMALMCIDIDYKALLNVLKTSVKNQKGCFYLFYEDRPVLSIHGDGYEQSRTCTEKAIKKILNQDCKSNKVSNVSCDGRRVYVTKKENILTGWSIIQLRTEGEILQDLNKSNQITMFLLVVVFAIVLLLLYWINVRILKPLIYFEANIRTYSSGDSLKLVAYEKPVSERVSSVMNSYNHLVEQVNRYIDREIIYEKNQRNTQAIALRYQINPHFLFNTLNVIGSIAEINELREVVDVTSNLSMILQYNIRGTKLVTLKEELAIANAYIEIQKVRFQNKIEIQYDVPETMLKEKIIKFILQPLLENVFKHACRKGDKSGLHIRISAVMRQSCLFLYVSDDGKGIEPEKLAKLNYMLEHEIDSQTILDEDKWEESIGLKNVIARIKNYYGNDCSIKLRSTVNLNTIVEIKLKHISFNDEISKEKEWRND